MVEKEKCIACKRQVKNEFMTLHHCTPKSKGGTLEDTIRLCKCCHQNLHFYIGIDEVPFYDSLEKLESHPDYKKYLNYIRNVGHSAMVPIKKIKKNIAA